MTKIKSDRKIHLTLLLLVFLTLAGITQPLEALTISMSTNKPQEIEPAPEAEETDTMKDSLPETVSQSIKAEIAQQNGLTTEMLEITKAEKKLWSDGCLGLAQADEICTQALVPGWRVSVTDTNQNTWIYRTDEQGETLKVEALPQKSLLN